MENIVRKGEIACNKLFSQCFLPYMTLIFHFKCTLKCRQFCFNLDQSKILLSGNRLILSARDLRIIPLWHLVAFIEGVFKNLDNIETLNNVVRVEGSKILV